MTFEIKITISDKNQSYKEILGEANNIQRSIAISELETIKPLLLKDNAKNTQEVIRI